MRAAFVAVAALLVACRTPSPEPARTDAAAVRQVLDSLNTSFERWYGAGQIDSAIAYFAADARQFPPNSPALVGRDSIRAFWTNMMQAGRWEFDFSTEDVVAAESLAVERGSFTLRFTPNPGAPIPAFEDRGNYVVLWRREGDGQWRIVWDAPVSVMPPPGAQQPGTGG